MNHRPHCIPCLLRRVLRTSNLVTSDDWLLRKILAEVMGEIAHVDDEATPAEVMHDIFRKTAKTLGAADPFQEEKKRWKEEILTNVSTIRSMVTGGGEPLVQALKLALLANEIDDELRQGLNLKRLLRAFETKDFEPENLDEFQASVTGARSILFVHDTVGEIFFDRLLIEEILKVAGTGCRVTSVVRRQAILGDATAEDAGEFGLNEVSTIVDPGLDCLGLPISECSTEFRETFASSDLVLAKGQACYQTLEEEGRTPDGHEKEVWFLFRVKCPVMAKQLAAEIGDLMLESN